MIKMNRKINIKKVLAITGYCMLAAIFGATIWVSFYPEFRIEPTLQEQICLIGLQIVTGLYGTILTGYIFLLSKIDNQIEVNPSIEDAVLYLKQRYRIIFYIISIYILLCLIGTIISILYRFNKEYISEQVYQVAVNLTLLFMICVITVIVYFINEIISPKRLEKSATTLKLYLSDEDEKLGNTKEFLMTYLEIEKMYLEKIPVDIQLHFKECGSAHIVLAHKYIRQQKLFSQEVCDNVDLIKKYHSCLLYGNELTVTADMCCLAEKTLKQIKMEKIAI